ncbi:MAG: exodeoxyribonuclease VII large subunit [Candidatus Aminicenantes bacterium]|nr:exodeoxyribonuclease VII large subunit [Candidatus Aminicenantes bacterium]
MSKFDSLVLHDRVYTVSELTEIIKLEIESSFPFVWVEGEISNFRRHLSGHLYFTLKDERAQLKAVMFRAEARQVAFEIKDGLKVICRGRLTVYEPRGEYQIVVEVMEPKGKGALQLAFEQLKEKLRAEGLFDPQHKKKLPLLPKKIGLVTSPRGAAIVDILRILERRFARLHILIYPVRVQGDGAAEEIVEGIEYLNRQPDIDVIIVGRGGGSIEDLWAFNEEKVARAIFHSSIPLISAVGHEVDFTTADFVADVRASTPSAAAELVIEKEEAIVERLSSLEKSLFKCLELGLQRRWNEVHRLAENRVFQGFRLWLRHQTQRIDDLEERAREAIRSQIRQVAQNRLKVALLLEKLRSEIKRDFQERKGLWEKLASKLHALSPLNILERGYTLCWMDGNHLVQSIDEVNEKDELVVSFWRGEFQCLVTEVDKFRPIESRIYKEKK